MPEGKVGVNDAGIMRVPHQEQARGSVENLPDLLDVSEDDVGLQDILVPVVPRRTVDEKEVAFQDARGQGFEEAPARFFRPTANAPGFRTLRV